MRRYRCLAAAFAAFALTGCYVSEAPLITPETADYPVETGTHFDGFAPSGTDWRPQPGRTLHRSGDYYVYLEDGAERPSVPFLFKEISPEHFIVQMPDTANPERITEYYYQLVTFDGTTAIQYSADCRPRPAWTENGLIDDLERTSTNFRCHFTDFESLETVLREAAVNAAPDAKFILTPENSGP